ncbi:MAG: hypothetical protein ACXQTN_03240, partial [Methanoculleaceae archaeon]
MIEWLSDNYDVSVNAVVLKYIITEGGDEDDPGRGFQADTREGVKEEVRAPGSRYRTVSPGCERSIRLSWSDAVVVSI